MHIEVAEFEGRQILYSVIPQENGSYRRDTPLRREEVNGALKLIDEGKAVEAQDTTRKVYFFEQIEALGQFRLSQ
jgi:hypothetical protein